MPHKRMTSLRSVYGLNRHSESVLGKFRLNLPYAFNQLIH